MFCEILKASKGLPVTDPLAALWGQKIAEGGAWQLTTITGTLPLTVLANGKALKNYKIYGETVQDGIPTPDNPVDVTGLGVRTDNLFDKDDPPLYPLGYYLNEQGIATKTTTTTKWFITNHIKVKELTTYKLINITDGKSYGSYTCFYNSNKNFIGSQETYLKRTKTVTTPQGCAYMCISRIEPLQTMIIMGDEIPDVYIPYGYKLPLTVTADGATTDYPVYIGDSQLMEEEYVDYREQKMYKRTENLFDDEWFDESVLDDTAIYVHIYVGEGSFTCATTCPRMPGSSDSTSSRFIFFLSGSVNKGAQNAANGVWVGAPRTVKSSNGYVTLCYRKIDSYNVRPWEYETMIVEGSTAPDHYIPYLQPTDPPVPLPKITLPNGEATIDIEGELKPQAAVIGEIKEI